MVPAEGCLGLNFKAKMNRVGRASPRTSRQAGGGSRDPSWKASHGTQEPRRNVRADLNVDREKSVSVQTYMGVGSRKWSKPGEEADQLEWSQKNGHSHHKPLPSPAGWWGRRDLNFPASPPNIDCAILPLQVGRLRPHC